MKRFLLLAMAAVIVFAAPGNALDVREIILLKQNGVSDEVIVNIIRNNRLTAPLTSENVAMLSSSGASPALMAFLTGPEARQGGMAGGVAVAAPVPRTFPEPPYQNTGTAVAHPYAPVPQTQYVSAAPRAGNPLPQAAPQRPAVVSQSLCPDSSACDDAPTIIDSSCLEGCYEAPAVVRPAPVMVASAPVVVAAPAYYASPYPYYSYRGYYDYPRYYGGWSGGWRGSGRHYGPRPPAYRSGGHPRPPRDRGPGGRSPGGFRGKR